MLKNCSSDKNMNRDKIKKPKALLDSKSKDKKDKKGHLK